MRGQVLTSGEGSSLDKTAFSAGGVCGFFGKAGHADGSHFKRGPVVQAPLSRLDPFAQAMTPGPGVARWCNTLVWGTDPYLLATVRILAGYNRMLISTLSASELAMKQNRWARCCILSISAGSTEKSTSKSTTGCKSIRVTHIRPTAFLPRWATA